MINSHHIKHQNLTTLCSVTSKFQEDPKSSGDVLSPTDSYIPTNDALGMILLVGATALLAGRDSGPLVVKENDAPWMP